MDPSRAQDQLKNFNSNDGGASLFVNLGITQGPFQRVAADTFPGGTQDDPDAP